MWHYKKTWSNFFYWLRNMISYALRELGNGSFLNVLFISEFIYPTLRVRFFINLWIKMSLYFYSYVIFTLIKFFTFVVCVSDYYYFYIIDIILMHVSHAKIISQNVLRLFKLHSSGLTFTISYLKFKNTGFHSKCFSLYFIF